MGNTDSKKQEKPVSKQNYRKIEYINQKKKKKKKYTSVVFRWKGGGKMVSIVGSWNGWKEELRLQWNEEEKCHVVAISVSEGKQYFRFLVDSNYRIIESLKKIRDGDGFYSNEVIVTENTTSIPEQDPEDEKKNILKERLKKLPSKPPKVDFPSEFSQKPYQFLETKKTPPLLPPHMKYTPLRSNVTENDPSEDSCLPIPLHVTINHMYFSERNNLKIVGITNTYGDFEDKKYTTVVYYFEK